LALLQENALSIRKIMSIILATLACRKVSQGALSLAAAAPALLLVEHGEVWDLVLHEAGSITRPHVLPGLLVLRLEHHELSPCRSSVLHLRQGFLNFHGRDQARMLYRGKLLLLHLFVLVTILGGDLLCGELRLAAYLEISASLTGVSLLRFLFFRRMAAGLFLFVSPLLLSLACALLFQLLQPLRGLAQLLPRRTGAHYLDVLDRAHAVINVSIELVLDSTLYFAVFCWLVAVVLDGLQGKRGSEAIVSIEVSRCHIRASFYLTAPTRLNHRPVSFFSHPGQRLRCHIVC